MTTKGGLGAFAVGGGGMVVGGAGGGPGGGAGADDTISGYGAGGTAASPNGENGNAGGGGGGGYNGNGSGAETLANTVSLLGGNGGAGGDGGSYQGTSYSAGGGGAGGFGALVTGTGENSNSATITGGNGGQGGADSVPIFPQGANGGDGGDGVDFVATGATFTNSGVGAAVVGGVGGADGSGGNGGNGGDGVDGAAAVINSGTIAGGGGGSGVAPRSQDPFFGYYGYYVGRGGVGGVGGDGVDRAAALINSGTITGGDGGSAIFLGFGGGGGAGGDGAVITGAGQTSNSGKIVGGNGGGGGVDIVAYAGGAGGAGLAFGVSGATLDNSGTIAGGDGGTSTNSQPGAGGVGVSGAGLTIIDSGAISGGLANGGSGAQADAIDFTGGVNSLTLQAGYAITGDVVAYSAADALVLGGDVDGAFDVSQIGTAAQYENFGVFEKTGASTWTLENTTSADTPWAIDGGALAASSDGALGNSANPSVDTLSFAGGALEFLSGFTTSRAITLNDGGGAFDTDGNNATLAGVIGGSGGLEKDGLGALTLSNSNAFSGGVSLDGGALDLSAAGAAGADAITFGGDDETLRIENAALSANTFGNSIADFGEGDVIDLAGLSLGKGGATAQYDAGTDTLTVMSGGITDTLTLTTPIIATDAAFQAIGDKATGTEVILAPDPGPAAANASIIVGHNQSVDETALVDGLVTPGLAGDSETITAVTGNAALAGGVVTYTAPASGPDAFNYTVQDEYGDTATGTVNVTVDPGPIAADGSIAVGHNQSFDETALVNGLVTQGLAGDSETITTVTGNAALAGGVVNYTSPASGPDAFNYTVQDEYGDTATGTVNVTVDPGPIAADGSIAVGHNQSFDETALVDGLVTPGLAGDSETITAVTGNAALAGGVVTYTAPASGPDAFNYTVQDEYGDTATGTVNVTVDPGPIAADGSIAVGHNQSFDETALVNGLVTQGLAGDSETITTVTGNAALAGGVVNYTSPASGPDAFNYTVQDEYGDTATGTVNVTVDPGPIAADGSIAVGHNQSFDETALVDGLVTPGLAGDSETITAVTGNAALAGGVVTYTAPASGPDAFNYTVQDEYGDTATGTVNVTVDPGPIAADGSIAVGHNQSFDETALVNGLVTQGLAGDSETITTVTGNAALAGGVVNYTSPASGPDAFNYTVQDEYGDTATGTVNVTVDPGPIAADGSIIVGHNQSVDETALVKGLVTPGLAGDSETITAVTGNAALAGGVVTYTAPASGPDAFNYTVQDEYGDTATGTVNVTVDPGPAAANASIVVGHNQSVDETALVDGLVTPGVTGDSETLTAVTGNAALAGGVVTYTAPASGPDAFNYTVEDEYGDTATGTVNVTVDPGPAMASAAPSTVEKNQKTVIGTVAPGLVGDTLSRGRPAAPACSHYCW